MQPGTVILVSSANIFAQDISRQLDGPENVPKDEVNLNSQVCPISLNKGLP